jgi:hypothetical protein
MIELNLEKQIETNINQLQIRKSVSIRLPNFNCRNFLIRGRNSEFYPPLERLQNSLGFWYSGSPRVHLEVGLKSKFCPDSSICPELRPSPTFSDHTSWTFGRMRAYLIFLERSQNSPSLLHGTFLLILQRIQSVEFCEIIISLNQNLYPRFFHMCAVFQRS